ncbi:hypothetical protein [Candidatus Thiosymbion oneisti]|nr:hypothetical protein [Candidatus Thiosymbion oneisti]
MGGLLPLGLFALLLMYKSALSTVPFTSALHGTFLIPLLALFGVFSMSVRLRANVKTALVLAAGAIALLAVINEGMMLLLGLVPIAYPVQGILGPALAVLAFLLVERVTATIGGQSLIRALLAGSLLVPLLALAQRLEGGVEGAIYSIDNRLLWTPLIVPVGALFAWLRRQQSGAG